MILSINSCFISPDCFPVAPKLSTLYVDMPFLMERLPVPSGFFYSKRYSAAKGAVTLRNFLSNLSSNAVCDTSCW